MSFPPPFFRWRPHPWHGLSEGERAPEVVEAYIELTPYDSVKYEVDKTTGYLRVDRPQRTSAQPPSLYGFIPRTYCGRRVCTLSPNSKRGDSDPLDICVISERPINRGEVILQSRVIGGLKMIDNDEADDKIVAVLENDNIYGDVKTLSDLPDIMIERLRHYFSTYKLILGEPLNVSIDNVYEVDHAKEVVEASLLDYLEEYGD
ncbi:MAG: inorganic pyrophosphatase [Planctomycetota bacterium]|nr:MAG: inorganic pyrophosphatase [Planctomycetota bacterium]